MLDDERPTYACKCLNIRIRIQAPAHVSSPPVPPDSEWTPVHVGDEGITVIHPQVTLRTRSRGVPVEGTNRCSRYTSLTCLICGTVAYRVHQLVPVNLEGKEGPLLPADDRAEQEVMKSRDGWIEVHESCMAGDSIIHAARSSSYSKTFSMILPCDTPPEGSSQALTSLPSSSRPHSPSVPPQSYLSTMRPLFPPAPFTPSHPTFVHFSSLAADESQKLRNSAEADISKLVVDRIALVQQAEDKLRRHVEIVWKKYRESINNIAQDRSHPTGKLSIGRHKELDPRTVLKSGGLQPSPISVIRDFNPTAASATIPTNPIVPRMSGLSASLATSSFHHPKDARQASMPLPSSASDERSRPVPHSPHDSLKSISSNTSSSSSAGSSPSISLRESNEIPEPFKRSMDPVRDTATSFKYFTDLEADITKARREQGETVDGQQDAANHGGQPSGGHSRSTKPLNGDRKHRKTDSRLSKEHAADESSEGAEDAGHGFTKRRRKVTFDVKSDVVAVNKQTNLEQERNSVSGVEEREMIFDLDDEGSERAPLDPTSRPSLPLPEAQISRPRRFRTSKATSRSGLPQSLEALRPASLPLPSHSRLSKDQEIPDPPRQVPPQPTKDNQRKQRSRPHVEGDENEVQKLAAANIPSHRATWSRDGNAWHPFVRRGDVQSGIILEETEDEDAAGHNTNDMQDGNEADNSDVSESDDPSRNRPPVVGSLPIAINRMSRPREILSLTSYQPRTDLERPPDTDSLATQPHGKSYPSSTALRKATYAERDRTRSIDPGALDFTTEDDENDGSDEDVLPPAADNGERGRKRALKIIQAFNELPEPGMWRSLA